MQFDSMQARLAVRTMCEESQLYFTRYMFKERERTKFVMNWHHVAVARAFDMVYRGEISRLLITLPPGFTKTMFLLDFFARGYALDPMCKNIHITYNSQLANNNSRILKDTIELPAYKSMWDVSLSKDSNSKKQWNTKHGGGLVASGVMGTITGFRAGRITEKFSGAIGIDDPLKPEDAFSKRTRDKTNGAMNSTIRSRAMLPSTPIVLTMQRVHDDDPVGFCLRGGTGDYWHHLNLPAFITPEHIKPTKGYARRYPYGIPLVFEDLYQEGWTWPLRVNKKEYKTIYKGSPIVARAQYDQDPDVIEGAFIKGKWLKFYKELPDLKGFNRVIAIADTALETKQRNDRTVWGVFGLHKNGHAYLLDYSGKRLEVPDIETSLENVWDRFRNSLNTGLPRISAFYVEKKASGHGIIQKMKRHGINVIPVERSTDKLSRVMAAIPAWRTGAILLPAKNYSGEFTRNKQWPIMHNELMKFSTDMTHDHDDYVDVLCDAADIFYNVPSGFRSAYGKPSKERVRHAA